MQWYTRSPQEVMEELSTREHGLTGEEVKANALRYGQNKLPETKPDSVFKIFLKQFQSPIIYILLIAALIVFFMEEYIDGTIILFVLILNAVIGSVQEGRAQNTLLALRKMITTNAAVLRDHKEVILPDHEVVPGDILVLKEGDKVSADARIISSNSLKVDEAALTGESEPVTKTIDAIEKDNLQVADQRNMIFKGTNIVGGEARAVVVSTGVNTVIGAISLKLTDVDTDVPLKKNIKSLSRLIIITVLAVSAAIFVAGVFHGIGIRGDVCYCCCNCCFSYSRGSAGGCNCSACSWDVSYE
jgi:magnesium-transporting ATPase (P-type)